jgi:predicted transcriptional regulator
MTAITVELEDEMLERVRQYSAKTRTNVSDVFAESVRKFLLLADLTDLQQALDGKARAFGFETEEDLFNAIS